MLRSSLARSLQTPAVSCCMLSSRTPASAQRRIAPVAGVPYRLQQQQHWMQHAAAEASTTSQQQQRRSVLTQAVQVDVLLGGLSGIPGWAYVALLLMGMLLGMAFTKLANSYLRSQVDPADIVLENAELRTKVEELQQLVLKVQPLAYKSMRLRFTKGINKQVILGLVDQMLANKEVNIWWLPDAIERVFYYNMMTLMLAVLEEVVDGMSMSLAGHNVKLQLSYLDVAPDGTPPSKQALKTEAMLRHALQPPPKEYGSSSSSSSSDGSGSSGTA